MQAISSLTRYEVRWCQVLRRTAAWPVFGRSMAFASRLGNGVAWYTHVQSYDSPFGLEPTDAITLHRRGDPSYHPSLPAVPIFDDNLSYYDPTIPTASVMTPMTGTQIRVKSISAHGSFMQVEVRPSK